MNLIAAVDENWAIGNKGQLLVRIPADHRMFRQETLGKVVVYGRKTLETFPMAQLDDVPRENIYCIGGESVYRQMLPYCDTAHITKIDYAYEADAYFPNLDADPDWEITADSDEQTYFDLAYTFVRYERIRKA